jgi:3-oxoacyl-[acyl-carrier protein] reductase
MYMKTKTAFITGGSKGIGFGIAKKLNQQGINCVLVGRNQQTLDQAVSQLQNSSQAGVLGIVADVRDSSSLERAVAVTMDRFGGIDYLIANAGVGHFASIEDLTLAQWQETIDINLSGVFYTVKAAWEAIKKSQGYIITISSLAGTNFFEKGTAYNASKFGLTGFTQALMLDARKYGIKTTTIMPGSVATYFNNRIPTEADAWKIQIDDIGQIVSDLINMHPRVLPSKIEVRPTQPN